MSQLDFIKETSSDFFDALIASDLADVGFYFPPTPTPPPLAPPLDDADGAQVRVLVRRDIKEVGSFGHAPGQNNEVRFVNSDFVTLVPRRDALVKVTSISAGAEYFKLVSKVADNGAISTWSALRVA
jgi:hypothetical protein